jgi:hypothetical protein
MVKLETDCAKWDIHTTETELPNSFPGVKVVESEVFFGYTLHKWKEDSPRGEFIAIVNIENYNSLDNFDNLKFDLQDIINGESVDNIHVFKYHANQWRNVIYKKKWVYVNKLEKGDCNVQRFLKD